MALSARRMPTLSIAVACTTACASLLAVDEVGYVEADGGGLLDGEIDAPLDADADAAADAAAKDDAEAGCKPRAFDFTCHVSAVPDSGCTQAAAACTTTVLVAAPDAGTLGDGAPAPSPFTFPFGLAVDDSFVYWTTQEEYDGTSRGAVRRARKDAPGSADTLALDQPDPRGIAVDDAYVYWFTGGPGPLVQRVSKCAPACGGGGCPATEAIATTTLHVQGGSVFVLDRDTLAVGVDDRFYGYKKNASGAWVEQNGDRFTAGGFPVFARASAALYVGRIGLVETLDLTFTLRHTTLFQNQPVWVVSDCVRAFAMPSGSAEFFELLPDGGTLPPRGAPGGSLFASAADATFIYQGLANGGGLWRVKKDGSRLPEQLSNGSVWSLAVDDEALYWGEHGSSRTDLHGEIKRLVK